MEVYKNRRLRIAETGLENYTGTFGAVEFENGVSVDEVEWAESQRLGSIVRIEDADNSDHQINEAAEMIRSKDVSADDLRVANFDKSYQVDGEVKIALNHYTREELEAIADKEGLAGVRELARARGGTGRSILECIDSILKKQSAELAKRDE